MSKQPFEIGLTLAGAVSAGAYSAGVMDFIIEALDVWHDEKSKPGSDVPRHEVSIKVMSGASAGSITAAVATAAMLHEHHPVHDPAQAQPNRLYDTWVSGIDIKYLLEQKDLDDASAPARSLLDSSILDTLAGNALKQGTLLRRSYLAEPLHLMFTVTNLRGVPYNLGFRGNYAAGHDFRMHGDHVHLLLSEGGTIGCDGAVAVPWSSQSAAGEAGWRLIGQAALASGAFPIGLKPRTLEYTFGTLANDIYWQRKWQSWEGLECAGQLLFKRNFSQIEPQWVPKDSNEQPYSQPYRFVCVDGGSMNNEPLELARGILAGADGFNPREGGKARAAVIMIDPFPDQLDDKATRDDLFSAAIGLIGAWKAQSRFRAMDIALAQQADIYSRFLIAPVRADPQGNAVNYPIASASVGAFGGFLSEDFRRHDFQLGRRNARGFLDKHFTLPENNPLFKDTTGAWDHGWSDALAQRYGRDEDGKPYAGIGPRHLPIIPVLDSIPLDAELPAWNSLYSHERLDGLRKPLRKRILAVGERLADQGMHDAPFLNGLIGLVIRLVDNKLADAAIKAMREELVNYKLLPPRTEPEPSPWPEDIFS